ncbi:MAG: CHASE domain-containing protein, partial [Usitatibacteraceae bacterium]
MANVSNPDRRFASAFALALPWLVLTLGLLACGIGWDTARESQQRRIESEFRTRAERATVDIRSRLLAYEQVLRGGIALYAAAGSLTRQQWRAYVERLNIDESLPGVQGIGVVRFVGSEDKAKHVAAMRAEGPPDYDIRPAGVRPEYGPIVYLEPFSDRVPRATGFDMLTEPSRRDAMERARDHGVATITGEVKWIQESDQQEQRGFLMYLPMYRGGSMPASVEARRTQLAGYVYAAFRMDNLVGGTLDWKTDGIDLEIFDGTAPVMNALLFDLDKTPRFLGATSANSLSMLSALDLNSRTWTLRYEALPSFFAARDDRKPLLVLIGGGLISLLLFGLTWFAAGTRKTALVLAGKMSRNLHESEIRFEAIFHSAMDAIISIDDKHNIVHFNPAAEHIFLCTTADAIGSSLARFLPERFRAAHGQHVVRFGQTGVTDRQMGKQNELYGLRA